MCICVVLCIQVQRPRASGLLRSEITSNCVLTYMDASNQIQVLCWRSMCSLLLGHLSKPHGRICCCCLLITWCQKDVSVFKNTCCSPKSQSSAPSTHLGGSWQTLISALGDPTLSSGLYRHPPSSCAHTHTHNLNINKKNPFI